MSLQIFSKDDWLDKMYRMSESARTRQVEASSLSMFQYFCDSEGLREPQMIERYQALAKEGDIRSICLSLDKFVQFLDKDHDEIILNKEIAPIIFKKKSPKTTRTYFGFVKSYLRICHAIRLSIDDIKDYVTFPRPRREPRKAISIKTLKLLFNKASPERRTLYYTLISSGMRIGEALALTKQNFHFDENPVRITLDAETTKTKEGRETYISSEAVDKIKPLIEGKKDDERIFTNFADIGKAVVHEDHVFADLRKKLKLEEKYKQSNRFVINIHSFRAYFHTKASQKHGLEYANALDGHGAYLKQYYRLTDEDRARKYKELEPDLLIESVKLETEKTKDKIIESLENKMIELQAKMERLELLNRHP